MASHEPRNHAPSGPRPGRGRLVHGTGTRGRERPVHGTGSRSSCRAAIAPVHGTGATETCEAGYVFWFSATRSETRRRVEMPARMFSPGLLARRNSTISF